MGDFTHPGAIRKDGGKRRERRGARECDEPADDGYAGEDEEAGKSEQREERNDSYLLTRLCMQTPDERMRIRNKYREAIEQLQRSYFSWREGVRRAHSLTLSLSPPFSLIPMLSSPFAYV